MTHGSTVTANPETVVGMLESLGNSLFENDTVHFSFFSFMAICIWINYHQKLNADQDYRAGDLLKLLDVSSVDNMLLTTYGKLQPPLGKHRLKVGAF